MGANQSSTLPDEKVFQPETPISFSQDVVNQLSDRLESSQTSPERQSVLDDHIRSRIQGELEHLRREEESIREEVERALEKENLDRERSMAGEISEEDGSVGDVKNSAALLGDLEEIRSKIERYQSRRDLEQYPDVKANGESLVECYRKNPSTPLDCWKEVKNFKSSVAVMEQQYFKSL